MKFICLWSLIFCGNAFASFGAGNYCKDFLENKSGDRPPFYQKSWDLKEDGAVVFRRESPETSKAAITKLDEFQKVTFMKEDPSYKSKKFAEFKYDTQNRLIQMVIRKGDENEQKDTDYKTTITFAYENGRCYPLEEVVSTNADKEKDIKFNMLLCRELETYLKKNEEALECQCGNDVTNKDLTKILTTGGVNPASLVSDSVVTVDTEMKVYERVKVKLLKKIPALSLPTLYALNKRSECKNVPGVNGAMIDDNLWKIKEQDKTIDQVSDKIKRN